MGGTAQGQVAAAVPRGHSYMKPPVAATRPSCHLCNHLWSGVLDKMHRAVIN